MMHSSLAFTSRRLLVSACVLTWMVAACASGDVNGSRDAAEEDGHAVVGDASLDVPGSDADAALDAQGRDAQGLDADARVDARTDVPGLDADARADVTARDVPIDAPAPHPPACHAGDRTEWSGLVPNTNVALSVCSACGKSYVVAANGGPSAGQVTVNNGSSTIMSNVAAGGTATTAEIADDPADGRVTVCATAGTHGCLPSRPQNQKYCNPIRSLLHLVPERIDQGVDYAGSGPIYAIAPGTINVYHNRDDSGWPGGTFVSYRISVGPAAGKDVFLAENVDLDRSLHLGSFVYSGTVLGTLVNAFPNCETGWGVVGGAYTAEHSCYVEGCSTALGINFDHLLTCLHAPSGILESTGCCTSSMGYPSDWCTQLSHWQ